MASPILVDVLPVNNGIAIPTITGDIIRPTANHHIGLYPDVLDDQNRNWAYCLTEDDGYKVSTWYFNADQNDFYTMTNVVGIPPTPVLRFHYRAYNKSNQFGVIAACLTTHGIDYRSNELSMVPRYSYSYRWYYVDFPVNPFTGLAWTLAEVNALLAGPGPDRSSGGFPTIDYFFVEVKPSGAIVAPTVVTNLATAITEERATLNGTLDDDGGEACDCGFLWGETIVYGNTTPTQSKVTGENFSQVITGLDPNTTYHFRAFGTNGAGTDYGADRAFTTQELLIISKAHALAREEL